ncbi:MAG: T9SS type A sorting domain-containing protein [Bacteroidota bacterium]
MYYQIKHRIFIASVIGIVLMATIAIIEPQKPITVKLPLFSGSHFSNGAMDNPYARWEWENMRLQDPVTGQIPPNIRRRELAFAGTLPNDAGYHPAGNQMKSGNKTGSYYWTAMGPYNVGGRTRAATIDVTNENVILAGGVSGGLWRTTDGGTTWTKVTASSQHHSITCIAQDTRPGKTNVWYFGSGEVIGNSASKDFSASYLGNGVSKSVDGGITWDTLSSTVSGTPQTTDLWDRIWNITTDPSIETADVVYAAVFGSIQRSVDGGETWTTVIGASGILSYFTDISVTSTGVAYATMSSISTSGNNAANKGIWRSEDGVNWTNIKPSGWPGQHWRTVIGIDPSDENNVYFLAHTPGYGQQTNVFFDGIEWNSLWKYTYLTGNGADTNGIWQDLSSSLPAGGPSPFDNFNAQGSYNLVVAVKPDDPNTVFIGGTNLYRSTDGFTSPDNTTQIGGYEPGTTLPYFEIYPNQHPDQHVILFLPLNPNVMISATDGGVFKTSDCMSPVVSWTTLNKGYLTTQFYTIAIDHGILNSNVIIGGLQDNGSWWTNSTDPTAPWTFPSTGDGAFCAIEDGADYYYFSRQVGKILKVALDINGNPTAFTRIDPITDDTINGGDYLFINPFILDPVDNNVMYLAEGSNLWRNDDLSQIVLNNQYDSISAGWTQLTNIIPLTTSNITALACSKNPAHRLYYGTNSRRIFRIDSTNVGNPSSVEITNNIGSGGYTSCIAVDPRDADKVLVVYSNYKVYSLYYSENGGDYWLQVSGNLETNPPPGAPLGYGLGDGPSCRWASIIPDSSNTIYLLGTSIGLFATDTLIADSTFNDSTVWVQQGANSIGNVVVEMIDYRQSDGFVAVATHGNGVYSTHLFDITGVSEDDKTANYLLELRNYPNPANNYTIIEFNIPEKEKVTLCVYDVSGRKIETLINKEMKAGKHFLKFNTQLLSSGIYYYSLSAGNYKKANRLIIHK